MMGRIGLKLSHVMPHTWFHKGKDSLKTEEPTSHWPSGDNPPLHPKFPTLNTSQPSYKSPVNHKAVDIHFPSETPKRSPLNESAMQKEGNVDVSLSLYPLDINSDCTYKPLSYLSPNLDMDSERDDGFPGIYSASESKPGHGRNPGPFLDMRELERKLKAVETEDRRKYYSSPMFSVAMPTPRLDSYPNEENQDMVSYSFNFSADSRSQPLQVGYEVSKTFIEGLHHRSPNESYSLGKSSSSSSDTAFDRASSSMWERDVLSLTSEGSEVFSSAVHDSRYILPRTSPQSSRPKEKVIAAPSSPLTSGHTDLYSSVQNDRILFNGKVKEAKVPSSNLLESQPARAAAMVLNCPFQTMQPLKELLDHEEGGLPLAHYESDDQKSQQRLFRHDFSYSDSKERLLSTRSSFEHFGEHALSESDAETMSNYSKFKLKQRNNAVRKHYPVLQKSSNQHSYKDTGGAIRTSRLDMMVKSPTFTGGSAEQRFLNEKTAYENSTYDGPRQFKGASKAVRERTRDSSLQPYSVSESPSSKVFDSFAVVKCSYDPIQDFKESMIEMIIEKDLHTPKEMVELLQCYLTLNSESYHDTIVKVLREVWSELFQQEAI